MIVCFVFFFYLNIFFFFFFFFFFELYYSGLERQQCQRMRGGVRQKVKLLLQGISGWFVLTAGLGCYLLLGGW